MSVLTLILAGGPGRQLSILSAKRPAKDGFPRVVSGLLRRRDSQEKCSASLPLCAFALRVVSTGDCLRLRRLVPRDVEPARGELLEQLVR